MLLSRASSNDCQLTTFSVSWKTMAMPRMHIGRVRCRRRAGDVKSRSALGVMVFTKPVKSWLNNSEDHIAGVGPALMHQWRRRWKGDGKSDKVSGERKWEPGWVRALFTRLWLLLRGQSRLLLSSSSLLLPPSSSSTHLFILESRTSPL
jgi:hypothetical protein